MEDIMSPGYVRYEPQIEFFLGLDAMTWIQTNKSWLQSC